MKKDELFKYLKSEEEKSISGWDFSYLDGRWDEEDLPWNYKEIVKKYLRPEHFMLDMGTGGGEFLMTLNHPYDKTSVTEGYKPNYEICMSKLAPLGVKVYNYVGDDRLDLIDDNTFDIVINRHESYNESELHRILKPNGVFITQQVGAYNNKALATFFDESHVDQFPELTLDKSIERLIENSFDILYSDEYYPLLKFYDLGAIAYFAKIIEWEFINFSVDKTIDKFEILQKELERTGFISSKEHRFIIVALKK